MKKIHIEVFKKLPKDKFLLLSIEWKPYSILYLKKFTIKKVKFKYYEYKSYEFPKRINILGLEFQYTKVLKS